MFFALILSSLAANCNESSLDPGYICCEDNPCKGRCIRKNQSDYNSQKMCITESQYQVCYTGYIYPVIMLVFCVPTILFWVLSCVTKTNVPTCTWITNIFFNICFASFVQSVSCLAIIQASAAPIAYLVAGLTLFMNIYIFARMAICSGGPECCARDNFNDTIKENTMVEYATSVSLMKSCPCCCACCLKKPYDPFHAEDELCCGITEDKASNTYDCLRFLRESRSPRVSKDELDVIINENASIPPTPKSTGIAFYQTKNGYQIVKREYEPIAYGSWQENGTIEKISKDKVIYKCIPRYIYKENMKEEIERANAVALGKVQGVSQLQTSYDEFEFNGMTKRAIYGDSCAFNVCSTCCYRFFYEFLFCCGYNGISDYFWNRNAQRIVFKSMKELSMDDSLRAKSGERDSQNSVDNKDDLVKEESVHQSLV